MRYFFGILMLLLLGMSACDQKSKVGEEAPAVEQDEFDANKAELSADWQQKEQLMDEITQAILDGDLQEVKSLRWEKQLADYNLVEEVTAYLDAQGGLVKVVEYFVDGAAKKEGERIFYLINDEVVLTQERIDDFSGDGVAILTERQVNYEKGQPVAARQRSGTSVDEVDVSSWSKARTEKLAMETVLQVLSSEGTFKTHYLTYIQGEEALFLLFGEPKKDNRFVTALRVDEMTPFIFDLVENSDKNRYKEVELTFKVVGGYNEPEFRVVEDIRWKE